MVQAKVDYSKSVIYKLCCKNVDIKDIYVGSTTNLKARKGEHKTRCNNINSKKYNFNVYKFIRENGNWDNWEMIMLEEIECKNKMELHRRERYWLEQLEATLNSSVPSRSKQEYYEDNKESLQCYQKEYRENNKGKIKGYMKKYKEDNKDQIQRNKNQRVTCECGSKICKGDLARHKKTKKHINLMQSKQQ